jgi:hypothetical protein
MIIYMNTEGFKKAYWIAHPAIFQQSEKAWFTGIIQSKEKYLCRLVP